MNYRLEAFFMTILVTLFLGVLAGLCIGAGVLIAGGFYWLAALAGLFAMFGIGLAGAAMA